MRTGERSPPYDQVLMRDIDMKANAWCSIVSLRSFLNQHGGHIAGASLTVNSIRTSAIACRILSSAIDRCCKHTMPALEAAVMTAPAMLLPDLMPLTSRAALLAVLVLLPLREHGLCFDNETW